MRKFLEDGYASLPLSGKFDRDIWEQRFCAFITDRPPTEFERHTFNAGSLIGQLINHCDQQYLDIVKPFPDLNALDSIVLVNHALIDVLKQAQQHNKPTGPLNEAYVDILQILLDNRPRKVVTPSYSISPKAFQRIAQCLSSRVYLALLWNRICKFEWGLEQRGMNLRFYPQNIDLEWGRVSSIFRSNHLSHQHLFPIIHAHNYNERLIDYSKAKGRQLPYRLELNGSKKVWEFSCNSLEHDLAVHNLVGQIPFYLHRLMEKPFDKGGLTLKDCILGWLLLNEISRCIITSPEINNELNITQVNTYCQFSKNELIDLFRICLNFEPEKTDAFLSCISIKLRSFNSRKHDLWLTPLINESEFYWLLPVVQFNCQFHLVIDKLYQSHFDPQSSSGSKWSKDKGIIFEEEVVAWLNEGIPKNTRLNTTVCCAYLLNQVYPDFDNAEIDSVIRLGDSFLIVEAKSTKLQTNNSGYANFRRRIEKSDIHRQKRAFICHYQDFRKKHDPTAPYTLDPEKVYCCYLSSVPHFVGSKINGTPVVDIHILERYFVLGSMTAYQMDRAKPIEIPLYSNAQEAEERLSDYLHQLPQFESARKCFKKEIQTLPFTFDSFKIDVEEYSIDCDPDTYARITLQALEEWHRG